MTEYLELLERAAERGDARGIDDVLGAAHRNVRRRRNRRTGAAIAAACLMVASVALAQANETAGPAPLAATVPSDGVGFVPPADNFDVLGVGAIEGWDHPDRAGHIAVYQRTASDNRVDAALAISVTKQQQSTVLSPLPLDDGTIEGSSRDYAFGTGSATNGLVVAERKTATSSATYTIRVAARNLDGEAVVAVLESVVVGDDGTVENVDLPAEIPSEPVYEGPDTSGIGFAPRWSTYAIYRHDPTGERVIVRTLRNDAVPPALAFAWFYDATVIPAASPVLLRSDQAFGEYTALWNPDESTLVVVSSSGALDDDALRHLQEQGDMVDEQTWKQLRRQYPAEAADTTLPSTEPSTDPTTPGTSTTTP